MRPRILGVLLLALALSCATAATPGAAQRPWPAGAPGPDALDDAVASLAPPPPPGSDEAKADLAIVLWLQRTRTGDDVARARAETVLGLETFAAVLGPGFEAAAHPRTRALLERVHEAARDPVRRAKARFLRPRPYDADPRVSPAVERERSLSYPSGHATRGVALARIVAELVPQRRAAVLEAGRHAGYSRVIGGVHYPSDVMAGQRLGDAVADALLATPGFRSDLEAVRAAEWGGAPREAAPARP